jgi:hypothetical protein
MAKVKKDQTFSYMFIYINDEYVPAWNMKSNDISKKLIDNNKPFKFVKSLVPFIGYSETKDASWDEVLNYITDDEFLKSLYINQE